VWAATGEFLNELEIDCRGKIDIIKENKVAVVMGAEIKTSASAIGDAKKQLLRRFKIIRLMLEIVEGIEEKNTIYIGRVFYREGGKNGWIPRTAEDGSRQGEGGFNTLSFYYHHV